MVRLSRNEEKARLDEKKKQKQQIKKLTFDMDDDEEEEDEDDDASCGNNIKHDPDEPQQSTSVRYALLAVLLRTAFVTQPVLPKYYTRSTIYMSLRISSVA